MAAMLGTGVVGEALVAEPDDAASEAALALAPGARRVADLNALLAAGVDGVVIATPSALHAAQARVALEAGVAVFCQKPLGRDAVETRGVVEAARAADRLLGVDLSYRETDGMRAIRALIAAGGLGRVHAVELVFHNAYGPDRPWFRDPVLAGGGCVIDLGVHLVDLALGTLGWPAVERVSATLLAGGEPLGGRAVTEDYAVATLGLAGGGVASLACSWNLPAGREAVIGARFYGERGGAGFANVDGSFMRFAAARFDGTRSTPLAVDDEAWGGRAAAAWARRLAAGDGFDAAAERLVDVAGVLDAIYGR